MVIDEFIIENPVFPQVGRALDYKRIVELPDKDFAQLYLERMLEYRDKNGWWSEDKVPKCNECNEVIPNPQQLRRYHGLSMHPSCFKQFYEKKGDDRGIMRRYWQRVTNLVLDS